MICVFVDVETTP